MWFPDTSGTHFRDTLPGHFLGDRLTPAMWWGVGIIALAVTMVGLSPMLAEAPAPSEGDAAPAADSSGPLVGIALTIAGTFCQSLQDVYYLTINY